MLDSVAGDDAGVDGADRGANDPIGLDFRLMQGLVYAALIGAQRAAALQNEHDLPIRLLADHVDGIERRSVPGHGVLLAFDIGAAVASTRAAKAGVPCL